MQELGIADIDGDHQCGMGVGLGGAALGLAHIRPQRVRGLCRCGPVIGNLHDHEGQVSANRKKFRGTLERAEDGGWQIVWSDEPPVKPGQKVSKKRVPAPLQALGFTLEELREARLAPIVDFKGRSAKPV